MDARRHLATTNIYIKVPIQTPNEPATKQTTLGILQIHKPATTLLQFNNNTTNPITLNKFPQTNKTAAPSFRDEVGIRLN